MKPEIIIQQNAEGNFDMKTNIADKVAVISIMLNLVQALTAQMGKEQPLIQKPTLVLQ